MLININYDQKKKINLFLSKKDAKPRNKTLFKYFEPHLNILNNQKAFSSYREF